MKKLTITIYLTIALLIGGVGVSWGNSNLKANDAMRCAAIYMIATSITANNKTAAKVIANDCTGEDV